MIHLLPKLARFPYVAVFTSCHSPIDRYGEYEWVIGIATEDAATFETWESVKEVENQWLMGILPYELKNKLEPTLQTKANQEVLFPETPLFVPQCILLQKKGTTEWEIEGDISLLEKEYPALSMENLNKTPDFQSNFSRSTYIQTIETLKKHIKAGDFYEINLAQRFEAKISISEPWTVFQKLIEISPVPFAAFIKWKDKFLLSASPERFLQLKENRLVAQPIKGTAKRGKTTMEDEALRQALSVSIKEQAENVMIVDLMRNDLYRSAEINSVEVPYLFEIQTFPQVHQMVSTITARKKTDCTWQKVIANTFPPGSMTGAPKVMACQMIDRYESVPRGVYAGAAGFVKPNGDFDWNVIIRSLVYDAKNQYLTYHVGGAITFDSHPEAEYEETLIKAQAIRNIWEQ